VFLYQMQGGIMAAKDKRPTLTVKGEVFTPEFRAKLNKAARRRGQTQAQFVAEVLEQAATRVLTGQPEEAESDAPTPALVERMEQTDAKLEVLAAQVQALTDAQRKTFWQRMFRR
jgi:uncharacterized protein (DUF1778 family)